MTKFFQATDGKITAFRATASGRAYQSAQLTGKGGIGFRSAPASAGFYPAVEITKAEFDALQAAKVERLKAEGSRRSFTSPQDSWVRNTALAMPMAALAKGLRAAVVEARKPAVDMPSKKLAKVLTGARGRVQANKDRLAAAKQEATGMPAKAAKAATPSPKAAKPAKAAKVNGKPAPREGSFQAAMIKVLVRPQGATRPEMQKAAGSKTMPNAHFLNLMADRFGYECYADNADRADVLVYQFVLPGAKPTAY
jgi:hypothetical protein